MSLQACLVVMLWHSARRRCSVVTSSCFLVDKIRLNPPLVSLALVEILVGRIVKFVQRGLKCCVYESVGKNGPRNEETALDETALVLFCQVFLENK